MTAEAVHKRFIEHGWTLSLAESCTGGSLAARLTLLPGASRYFLGSLVAYSNELKTALLHVPPHILEKHGAVSREVVQVMLDGILKLTGSDYALAVSGIAGPTGGSKEKPVGTIWAGIGSKKGLRHIWSWCEPGSRQEIIERSVDRILNELLKMAL